jgi:hypothetical protein
MEELERACNEDFDPDRVDCTHQDVSDIISLMFPADNNGLEKLYLEDNPCLIVHPPPDERKRRYAELRAAGVPVDSARSLRDLRTPKYRQIGKQAMQYWSGREVALGEPIKYKWWKDNPIKNSSGSNLLVIGLALAGLIYLAKAQEPHSITSSLPTQSPPYSSAPAPLQVRQEEE